MRSLKKYKKPLILFLVLTVVISCIVFVHSNNVASAKISELSDFKSTFEEEMNNFKLDDFNEDYETYMDWLDTSITNKYVEEGIRIKGLLEELKSKVIENNEEIYSSKYDEISALDINELEEEIKNDINSKRNVIEESKSSNKYKEAIEALDSLKEDISNSLTELQKKKEEEANKQKEEELKAEEEQTNSESDAVVEDSNKNGKTRKSKGTQGKANEVGNDSEGGQAGSYVKNLKVSSRTNQLVIVKGQGGSSATVEFHKKNGGVWNQVFSTSGYVGQNGITCNKREGDRKTPAGVYGFGTGFGVAQDPGSNINYRHIGEDDCWVDDSNSSHYNTWCSMSAPDKDWNSAEHMINFSEAYRYGIVIQYNTYDRTPGKGSGIFLHCKTRPTPGCVAIDSNCMVTLLQQINSSALIVIVPSEGDLNNY